MNEYEREIYKLLLNYVKECIDKKVPDAILDAAMERAYKFMQTIAIRVTCVDCPKPETPNPTINLSALQSSKGH